MKRENTSVDGPPNKKIKYDTIPIFLHEDYLYNIFSFLTGKDLNTVRLVNKKWYQIQSSKHFISSQCKILNLIEDEIVETYKEIMHHIAVSKVRVVLGNKQGEEERWKISKNTGAKVLDAMITYKNNVRKKMVAYFTTGEVLKECYYNGSKPHGPCIVNQKTRDGKILKKVICNYVNGKLDGEFVKYHSNGAVKETAQYKNGKLHGRYCEWTKDGVQITQVEYQNGKLHGEYIAWVKGIEIKRCNFVNNKLDGKFVSYFPNGIYCITMV